MKIGLIDVDGQSKKKKWGSTIYPNLALCKIASYHRQKGDTVEWYDGMFGGEYDVVYMAQWCNKRMIFASCEFKDFQPRKGFTCQKYFEDETLLQ